jgi:hypothetical protein
MASTRSPITTPSWSPSWPRGASTAIAASGRSRASSIEGPTLAGGGARYQTDAPPLRRASTTQQKGYADLWRPAILSPTLAREGYD